MTLSLFLEQDLRAGRGYGWPSPRASPAAFGMCSFPGFSRVVEVREMLYFGYFNLFLSVGKHKRTPPNPAAAEAQSGAPQP